MSPTLAPALRISLYFIAALQLALFVMTAEPISPSRAQTPVDPPASLDRSAPQEPVKRTDWIDVRRGLGQLTTLQGRLALDASQKIRIDLAALPTSGPVTDRGFESLYPMFRTLTPAQRRILTGSCSQADTPPNTALRTTDTPATATSSPDPRPEPAR